MKILHSIKECKKWRESAVGNVGFVPTMGALHAGHLSLIKISQKKCKNTMVSIYINPAQFAQNEDFSSYPQTIESDLSQLKALNISAVFLPADNEMYPDNIIDNFKYENSLFKKLEGKSRPHFFYGVTKIVSKLFDIIEPTHAFFGEKDAQQSRVIKQMIVDLNYNIDFFSCPIIRNIDGLALSSRNNYLTDEEQKRASIIYKSLLLIKKHITRGDTNTIKLKQIFLKSIHTCPGFKVDYISIACNVSLKELNEWRPNSLISAAVFYNKVRLIDNIVI